MEVDGTDAEQVPLDSDPLACQASPPQLIIDYDGGSEFVFAAGAGSAADGGDGC